MHIFKTKDKLCYLVTYVVFILCTQGVLLISFDGGGGLGADEFHRTPKYLSVQNTEPQISLIDKSEPQNTTKCTNFFMIS